MQLKLGEIIRAIAGAHNALLDLEELPEADLGKFRSRYEELARKACQDLTWLAESTPPARRRSLTADARRYNRLFGQRSSYRSLSAVLI